MDDAQNNIVLFLLVSEPEQRLHDISGVVRTGINIMLNVQESGKLFVGPVVDGHILHFR